MKWLRGRPVDVNELDECRIWSENQQAAVTGGDSEMIDEAAEVEEGDGEVEDQDMGPIGGETAEVIERKEVAKRKKGSKRRTNTLVNGDGGGGTPVSVGGGG